MQRLGIGLWAAVAFGMSHAATAGAQPEPPPLPAETPPQDQPPGAPVAPGQPAPPPVAQPQPPPGQPPPGQPPPGQPPPNAGAPQQYPAQQYPPGQPATGPAPNQYQAQGYPPPAAPPPAPDRSGVVVGFFAGFAFAGGGDADTECSGSACSVSSSSTNYDEESGFVLGLDVLGYLSPNFRLGGGLLLIPRVKLDGDPGGSAKLGTELSPLLIAEGVFDVAPSSALTLRGFGGPLILFPGSDLDDTIDTLKRQCDSVASSDKCDVKEGPYVGYTFGIAGGALFNAGTVGIHPALVFQYYDVNTAGQDANLSGQTADTSLSFVGTRFMLTVGLEI